MGTHFARGCSVVLGCARSCSILTWAYGTSRRSGEWWRQSLQARGRWFEPSCAHPGQSGAGSLPDALMTGEHWVAGECSPAGLRSIRGGQRQVRVGVCRLAAGCGSAIWESTLSWVSKRVSRSSRGGSAGRARHLGACSIRLLAVTTLCSWRASWLVTGTSKAAVPARSRPLASASPLEVATRQRNCAAQKAPSLPATRVSRGSPASKARPGRHGDSKIFSRFLRHHHQV